MQTTRYQMFRDGSIAVVTTRVARQGIVVETEEAYPIRMGQDPESVLPYESLKMAAENVVDELAEVREALMRCGWAASCAIPNTLTVCIPGGTFPRVATVYGDPTGIGISGTQAEPLSRVLAAEGVKVRVD
jgi:hypothetical protein|nr:MAG TPA: hypothetical protein [Caudoviricetes sp.]DAV01403.1 MAG TPA: hypothetical protein [Caudoviricetes sp.]